MSLVTSSRARIFPEHLYSGGRRIREHCGDEINDGRSSAPRIHPIGLREVASNGLPAVRDVDADAPHAVVSSTCEEGAPLCGRPFLVAIVGQRPLPKVGVTEPTAVTLLDVLHPVVVTNVSLRGAG